MAEPTREQVDAALADIVAAVEDPHEYATVGEHLDYWKDVARAAAAEVVRLQSVARTLSTMGEVAQRDAEQVIHDVLTADDGPGTRNGEPLAWTLAGRIALALYGESTGQAADVPQEGMSEDDVEHVCEALMEVGGWAEIDGDGTNATIIADHIRWLPGVLAEQAAEAPQPKVLAEVPTLPQPAVKASDKSMVLDGDLAAWCWVITWPEALAASRPPEAPEGGSDAG